MKQTIQCRLCGRSVVLSTLLVSESHDQLHDLVGESCASFVEKIMSEVAFFLAGRSVDALKQRSLYQCALKVNIYCEVR